MLILKPLIKKVLFMESRVVTTFATNHVAPL
jgi:hypothetical protein